MERVPLRTMVFRTKLNVVLLPNGMGPYFLPGEGESGTPPYDVFSVLS